VFVAPLISYVSCKRFSQNSVTLEEKTRITEKNRGEHMSNNKGRESTYMQNIKIRSGRMSSHALWSPLGPLLDLKRISLQKASIKKSGKKCPGFRVEYKGTERSTGASLLSRKTNLGKH
jgi:hypothetical protein